MLKTFEGLHVSCVSLGELWPLWWKSLAWCITRVSRPLPTTTPLSTLLILHSFRVSRQSRDTTCCEDQDLPYQCSGSGSILIWHPFSRSRAVLILIPWILDLWFLESKSQIRYALANVDTSTHTWNCRLLFHARKDQEGCLVKNSVGTGFIFKRSLASLHTGTHWSECLGLKPDIYLLHVRSRNQEMCCIDNLCAYLIYKF